MFCDLVGSTTLSARLDLEDLQEVIRAYQKEVAEVVTRFGGLVARRVGDGALIYFGYPHADEDSPEQAVRAGLALVEAVGRLKGPEPLQVRLGIATGLVVVGDLMGTGSAHEQEVLGEGPNLAARLQALAEPNAIVIADSTRRLVGSVFELEDLGVRALKGFASPQRAWRVVGEGRFTGRFEALRRAETPLIGREEEIELLLRRWAQAKAGEGRVVLVSGEPGIGKSRLIAELEDRLCREPHASLRNFCSPQYQQSALYPMVARLEQEMGFVRGDTPAKKLSKIEAVLLPTKTSAEDIALVADLLAVPVNERYPKLDFSPQRKKAKTFAAVTRGLVRQARQQPVLMLFEDAHWADTSSLELFDTVIDLLPSLPVLLVISFRPEFVGPWVGNANVTLVTLSRLNPRQAALLVAQVASERALSPRLVDRIVAQADGVPLFIEELTKAMLEIASEPEREARSPAVPATLQASLMARLDRLPEAKQVAQIAAVIGREFAYPLLAAVARLPEAKLDQGLDHLVGSGLAIRRGVAPDAIYHFKHALVQEAAYESQLRSRRGEIHAAIVAAGEAGTMPTIDPSLLGYHCAQAGLIAKAASYYRLAGEQSAARSAGPETRVQLERGLQFTANLAPGLDRDRLECELLLALGHALLTARGNADAEALAVFERAGAVSRRLNSPEALTRALFSQITIVLHRGDANTAQAIGEELLALGDARSDTRISLAAMVRLGHVACFQGRFGSARDNLSKALDLPAQPEELRLGPAVVSAPDVAAAAHLALSLACLGYCERAAVQTETVIQRTKKIFPSSLTVALTLGALHDDSRLREIAETQAIICQEQGFPYFLALARCLLGWLTAKQGDATGLRMLLDAVASLHALGIKSHGTWARGLMSDALAWAGRQSEAVAALDEALALSTRTGIAWFDAELQRRKGDLLVTGAEADPARAEQALGQAINIARNQSAKLFELRAAMSLARLWRDQGRCTQSRELLATIYDWFSEGFDLPDLKNARALLDDLTEASPEFNRL